MKKCRCKERTYCVNYKNLNTGKISPGFVNEENIEDARKDAIKRLNEKDFNYQIIEIFPLSI